MMMSSDKVALGGGAAQKGVHWQSSGAERTLEFVPIATFHPHHSEPRISKCQNDVIALVPHPIQVHRRSQLAVQHGAFVVRGRHTQQQGG